MVNSPCTVKLPAAYKSFTLTFNPVKPIAALAFVKYKLVPSNKLEVVNPVKDKTELATFELSEVFAWSA